MSIKGKSKTKTKVTPYDPAAIKAGQDALGGGYAQAQGTISKFSPTLDAAINQIGQNIAQPPSYVTDARTQLGKTINGDFVGSNPWTGGMADLIAKKTQGQYNASFGASGRSHGGLAALLSGQGVGDALQSFYSGQHEGERGRQQQAIGMAPGFHQGQYTDINALFPAVNNAAMMPLNAAATFAGGTGGLNSPYGTTTQTQKQGFGLGSALGLAGMIGGAFMPQAGLGGMFGNGGGLAGIMPPPVYGGGNMTGPINNMNRYLG